MSEFIKERERVVWKKPNSNKNKQAEIDYWFGKEVLEKFQQLGYLSGNASASANTHAKSNMSAKSNANVPISNDNNNTTYTYT